MATFCDTSRSFAVFSFRTVTLLHLKDSKFFGRHRKLKDNSHQATFRNVDVDIKHEYKWRRQQQEDNSISADNIHKIFQMMLDHVTLIVRIFEN